MGSCRADSEKTILYAAGILACGNLALQALGFLYRVILSHFAGAEGLGVYRLVNSAYLVLNAGCLSGVTMACSRLSAASEARGERGKIGAILRLAFTVFLHYVHSARRSSCFSETGSRPDGWEISGAPRRSRSFYYASR